MSIRAIVTVLIILLLVFVGTILYIIPDLISTWTDASKSAMLGIVIGGLLTLVGSVVVNLITAMTKTQETEQRSIDRVSNHALELTRLDFELRTKALETSSQQQQFLAPAKVYREFFKAIQKLHDENDWPKEIEKLGLLSIFTLTYDRSVAERRLREFYLPLVSMLEEGLSGRIYDPPLTIYPPVFEFIGEHRIEATNRLWGEYQAFRRAYDAGEVSQTQKQTFYLAVTGDFAGLMQKLGYTEI